MPAETRDILESPVGFRRQQSGCQQKNWGKSEAAPGIKNLLVTVHKKIAVKDEKSDMKRLIRQM